VEEAARPRPLVLAAGLLLEAPASI
jgi:hypothetical protein